MPHLHPDLHYFLLGIFHDTYGSHKAYPNTFSGFILRSHARDLEAFGYVKKNPNEFYPDVQSNVSLTFKGLFYLFTHKKP
jgi:hypothetical protein